MGTRSKLSAAAVVLAIAAAGFAFLRGEEAPEVRFVTLSGAPLATSDLRGRVVLVNFWATDCGICLKEMPLLVAVHRKFAPRGYETLAVAMSYDHPNRVAAYVQAQALPFRIALDLSGAAAEGFGGVQGTPTSILIDRRGRIVGRWLGEPDEAEFHRLVERTLNEAA